MKIEATASEWSAALKAVQPHAATVSAREVPSLQAIRVDVDETGAYLVATDRYTLIMRRLDAEVTGEGSFSLSLPDVKRIVSTCADWSKISVPLSLDVDSATDRATFTTPDSSATFAGNAGTFPQYRTLLYGAVANLDESDRTSGIGLNAAFLAKWAKSVSHKNESVQFRLTREQKVAVVIGRDFIGLHMPVRLEGFSVPSWAPQPVVKAAAVEAVA